MSMNRFILDDPETWRSEFSKRLKTYEDLIDSHKQQQKKFEDERRAALEALRKAWLEELKNPQEALYQVAPIYAEDVKALPTQRAAYSDRMSAMMAKIAMLAYVAFEDSQRKDILDGILKRGQIKLLHTIAVDETEAIVVETEKFAAVAFRGTTSRKDIRTDLQSRFNVSSVEVEGRTADVSVHEGFYTSFAKVSDQIREILLASGNKTVFFTGHSLGGALALVASAAFGADERIGDRIGAVYTFGAPRVGKRDFADYVKAPHYRVINQGDIVPLVPPNWLLGYVHTGMPLLLKEGANKPMRRRPWGSAAYYALLSLLAWPFTRQLIFRGRHDIQLYVVRLEKIARYRGKWT